MSRTWSGQVAIVGIGESEMGTVPHKTPMQLHAEAARASLQDCGLETSDIVLSVSGGWHTHLNILEDVLDERDLRPFYKMQLQYESEYGEKLGLS